MNYNPYGELYDMCLINLIIPVNIEPAEYNPCSLISHYCILRQIILKQILLKNLCVILKQLQ